MQFKSPAKFGMALVSGLLAGIIMLPRSLQAQTSTPPPALTDRLTAFDIYQPDATAFAIWNSSGNQRHEVWVRIVGGDALFQQRLRVYKEQAPPRSPDMLPPESELLIEIEGNSASEWYFLGFENTFHTYYFDGDNRFNSGGTWEHSKAVRAEKVVYSDGSRYTISFEDLKTLDDYNDLQIEVVLVHGRPLILPPGLEPAF